MPISRRGVLEAAGAGIVGGYALPKLVPSIWFRADAVRHRYPVQVSNRTDDPYEVTIRAYRGGLGGETLVLDSTITVESTVADGMVERQTVAVLRGTHRLVVDYRDGPTIELLTESEYGDCSVGIGPPDGGDRPPTEAAGLSCGV